MNTCENCKYFDTCGDTERRETCNGYERKQNTMKTREQIKKDIKKNADRIKALEADLEQIERKEERRIEANAKNFERLREISEEIRANADRITEICNDIYISKIAGFVLAENLKAATLAEVLPIIAEIVKPYEGKPYGEKTREKMRNAAKAQGYAFYFDGLGTRDRLEVAALDANGCCYHRDYMRIYAKYDAPFVDECNKIHFDVAGLRNNYHYAENPRNHAKLIAKTYEKYRTECKKAEKIQTELNDLLPETIDHFHRVTEPYATIF